MYTALGVDKVTMLTHTNLSKLHGHLAEVYALQNALKVEFLGDILMVINRSKCKHLFVTLQVTLTYDRKTHTSENITFNAVGAPLTEVTVP